MIMPRHTIQRQILELTFTSQQQARLGQAEISNAYNHDLLPMINEIFDSVVGKNEHLRINQLELDLGEVSEKQFKEDLKALVRLKLEDELAKYLQKAKTMEGPNSSEWSEVEHEVTVSRKEFSDLELFIYFVKTGRLPWWSNKDTFHSPDKLVHHLVQNQPETLAKAVRPLVVDDKYLIRIIHQLSDDTLYELLEVLNKENVEVRSIASLIRDMALVHKHFPLLSLSIINFRLALWKATFAYWVAKRSPSTPPLLNQENSELLKKAQGKRTLSPYLLLKSYFIFLIEDLAQYPTIQSSTLSFAEIVKRSVEKARAKNIAFVSNSWSDLTNILASTKTKAIAKSAEQSTQIPENNKMKSETSGTPSYKENEHSLVVSNAGLVLLTPFLPRFFEGLGLVQEAKFVTEDAAERAALLLHYMASKETVMPEYDLTLNKLLCGLPLDHPLPATLDLNDIEKEEIEHLLSTAAQHWEALKSTSGEGFRTGFLIREGILSEELNGWKLQIERTSIDVLLDRLPWSISIIKFPWCEQMLHVEW